jgi:hypothetical protein
VVVLIFYPTVGGTNARDERQAARGGPAMSTQDALAQQRAFEWRSVAFAKAGLITHAVVYALATEMCRAAAWAAQHGIIEAELRIREHSRGGRRGKG